jgi:sortase (surface protein transpeptidase)
MKVLRYLAIFSFAAGIMLLAVGFVATRGDSKGASPIHEFESTPSDTSTPTPTLEPSKTPTPTPTPFDGKVARMKIPRLKIDYPIEELGLKPPANEELDTPHDAIGKIGWYSIYAKPGWDASALFSAHVNYNGKDGPFAKLYQVQEGDEIDVQMDGGPEYKYRVFRLKQYVIDVKYSPNGDPSRVIDMGSLIGAPDRPEGKQWITLITCSCNAGRVINRDANGYGECVDRDVVVAERIQ